MQPNKKLLLLALFLALFSFSVKSANGEGRFKLIGSFGSERFLDPDIKFSRLYVNEKGEFYIQGDHKKGGLTSCCRLAKYSNKADYKNLIGLKFSELPLAIRQNSKSSTISLIGKNINAYHGWLVEVDHQNKKLVLMQYRFKISNNVVGSASLEMNQLKVDEMFWILLKTSEISDSSTKMPRKSRAKK